MKQRYWDEKKTKRSGAVSFYSSVSVLVVWMHPIGSSVALPRLALLHKAVRWAELRNKTLWHFYCTHLSGSIFHNQASEDCPVGDVLVRMGPHRTDWTENLRDSNASPGWGSDATAFIYLDCCCYGLLGPWPRLLVWPSSLFPMTGQGHKVAHKLVPAAAPHWEPSWERLQLWLSCLFLKDIRVFYLYFLQLAMLEGLSEASV